MRAGESARSRWDAGCQAGVRASVLARLSALLCLNDAPEAASGCVDEVSGEGSQPPGHAHTTQTRP